MNLKNTLAENMLRFGPKNLSESDRRSLQRLLTESTIQELDPLYENASKFLQTEWDKNVLNTQYATINLMYVASAASKTSGKYAVDLYKAIVQSNTVISFIIPQYSNQTDWLPKTSTGTDPGATIGFSTASDLQLSASKPLDGYTTLKDTATQINDLWSPISVNVATTHVTGRKTALAKGITTIKSSQNFAALGPMLTGTAKTVYDLIAA